MSQSPRNAMEMFDQVADTYDEAIRNASYIGPQWLEEKLHSIPFENHAHILDLGCPNGIHGRLIKRIYPQYRVTGVDISPRMVEAAKLADIYEAAYVHDLDEPLTNLPHASFDAIIALGFTEFLNHVEVCLSSMAHLLKPHGIVLMSFQQYIVGQSAAPRYMHSGGVIHHAYSIAEVEQLLIRQNLTIEQLDERIGYTGQAPCPYLLIQCRSCE